MWLLEHPDDDARAQRVRARANWSSTPIARIVLGPHALDRQIAAGGQYGAGPARAASSPVIPGTSASTRQGKTEEMLGRFDGKVAFVTGAASGIGEAAARLLAAGGAHVALADVDEDLGRQVTEGVRAAGGEALFVRCDVAADGDVDAAIDAVLEWRDRLDYAVNNAGVPPTGAPVVDCADDDWDRIIDINLKGVWRCMVRELAEMSDRGGGAIVNMSSVA